MLCSSCGTKDIYIYDTLALPHILWYNSTLRNSLVGTSSRRDLRKWSASVFPRLPPLGTVRQWLHTSTGLISNSSFTTQEYFPFIDRGHCQNCLQLG